jgi:hypothetical protein
MLNVELRNLYLTLRANQGLVAAYTKQLGSFLYPIARKVNLQAVLPKRDMSKNETFFSQIVNAPMDGDMCLRIIRAVLKMLNPVDMGYFVVGGQREKRQQYIFFVKLKIIAVRNVITVEATMRYKAVCTLIHTDAFLRFGAIPAFSRSSKILQLS